MPALARGESSRQWSAFFRYVFRNAESVLKKNYVNGVFRKSRNG